VLSQYQRKPASPSDEKALVFFKRAILPKKEEAVAGFLLRIAWKIFYFGVRV
jgi:hypothetical protein